MLLRGENMLLSPPLMLLLDRFRACERAPELMPLAEEEEGEDSGVAANADSDGEDEDEETRVVSDERAGGVWVESWSLGDKMGEAL